MELTHKQQKAVALAESISNTALAIAQVAKSIPRYKLPRIATAARNRRSLAEFKLYLTAFSGAAQAYAIASRPIPKYPNGGHHPGEWAVIGESGPETIVLSDDSIVDIPRKLLPSLPDFHSLVTQHDQSV